MMLPLLPLPITKLGLKPNYREGTLPPANQQKIGIKIY